jgi:flagellar biosynthesis protein FlhF
MILDRLRKELSVGELDNFAEVQQRCLEFIGERVRLDSGGISSVRPRVIVLVGPTGVGKTTTLCKLAAGIKYPENAEPRRVSLFTIDRYRIAADKQLGALAEYLHADFAALEDEDALRREIALRADNYDAILVDTVGRSPRDAVELAKMKKTLEACGKSEVYLVFTAATKTADIVEIMRQFEPFGYRAVIVTKLDETRQLGNVISALAETGKPLAYLTDGQVSTPKYLQRASLARLLTSLDGFNIDRERLNAHFGPPALNN